MSDRIEISNADKNRLIDALQSFQAGCESAFNDVFALTKDAFEERAARWFAEDSMLQDAVQLVYVQLSQDLQSGEEFKAAEDFLIKADRLLEETCKRLEEESRREVPRDLDDFLPIGKSIISTKDVKDFAEKQRIEKEKQKEAEIMNLH